MDSLNYCKNPREGSCSRLHFIDKEREAQKGWESQTTVSRFSVTEGPGDLVSSSYGSAGAPIPQAAQPTGGQAGCDLVANSGPTGACGGLEKERRGRGSAAIPAPASVRSLALAFLFFTP